MSIIKCKMCGGELNIIESASTAECDFCGSIQTIPKVDDEKKLTLFARANRLRVASEFDKAAGIYESIVADFAEEAEAYWGLVLCKYGIEYVDDPTTGKKIPTCHRSSFDSVMEDSDFEQALENADHMARKIYREEAKLIEQIRRDIIAVSNNEQPYDIFICYKETDENGERTIDSVLAQDVYDALTDKGYRTFFARISLEDKLGTEYEPYIFAALNSAKIMLVFGTDYEYFNAVWVKNEWSRFLKLMAKNKEKHLIPCFKGADAYDMPKEFAKLQAQDLGKVGAMQDLLRGISKILPYEKEKEVVKEFITEQHTTDGNKLVALLKRGSIALEDQEWDKADGFFEDALNLNAECSEAYLGKFLAAVQCGSLAQLFEYKYNEIVRMARTKPKQMEVSGQWIDEALEKCIEKYYIPKYFTKTQITELFPQHFYFSSYHEYYQTQKSLAEQYIQSNKLLQRALGFARGETKKRLEAEINTWIEKIEMRVEESKHYDTQMLQGNSESIMKIMASSGQKMQARYENACVLRENEYRQLCDAQAYAISSASIWQLRELARSFNRLGSYMDCEERYNECNLWINDLESAAQKNKDKRRWISEGKCAFCGGNFKGVFSKKCARCGREKSY